MLVHLDKCLLSFFLGSIITNLVGCPKYVVETNVVWFLISILVQAFFLIINLMEPRI